MFPRDFAAAACVALTMLIAAPVWAQQELITGPAPHSDAWMAHTVKDCTKYHAHITYAPGIECILDDARTCTSIPGRSLAWFVGGDRGPYWTCLKTPDDVQPGEILEYKAEYVPDRKDNCKEPNYPHSGTCFIRVMPPPPTTASATGTRAGG